MIHIWYECHVVKEFWYKIFEIYKVVSGNEMQPSVNVSILSIIPGSMKSIKTDILHHMTNAARTITARKWRKTIGHTIMEWICEMNE